MTDARTGRPRDARIDAAVLDAVLAVLDERGYAALHVEDIARRAGTSRPAIYRRWPGRAPLVLAALAGRFAVPEPPDTGCTICDLGEALGGFVREFRAVSPAVLAALYAECAADPALHAEFLAALFDPTRTAVLVMLRRATDRGDLRPDSDPGLIVDMLAALVYYRVLFGHSIDEAEIGRAVEVVLRGTAVDYPALAARSAQLDMEHSVQL